MDSGADSPSIEAGLTDDFAAALAWWRGAGVDFAFHDEPAQWLSPAVPTAREAARIRDALREPASAPAAASPAPPDRKGWPAELALFADWWLHEPWLDDGRRGGPGSGRVPPRGSQGAALMVLVPEPERDDGDRLLSGPQGRLLDAMLHAFGVPADQAYVASVLPRHTPMTDWQEIAASALPAVIDHHVRLVAPARLLCLGTTILPLLDNGPPNKTANSASPVHSFANIPMLAVRGLEALLARPRWKSQVWERWLGW